jgi:hypothetical protein
MRCHPIDEFLNRLKNPTLLFLFRHSEISSNKWIVAATFGLRHITQPKAPAYRQALNRTGTGQAGAATIFQKY